MASRAVVFRPVNSNDVSCIPFEANTTFKFNEVDSGSLVVRHGVYSSFNVPIGDPTLTQDNIRNTDGTWQTPIWRGIDHMFYRPDHKYQPTTTFEHHNSRYTEKNLFYSCSIIGIPYIHHGENIKRTSIKLAVTGSFGTGSAFDLYDDKYGNLRDPLIDSASFVPNRPLVAYWGFNDEYRHFEQNFGTLGKDTKGRESKLVYPSEQNKLLRLNTTAFKVRYKSGVATSGEYQTGSGIAANFESDSGAYIITEDNDRYNFNNIEDFAISFWCELPHQQAASSSQMTSNPIITKNGVERVPINVTRNGRQVMTFENQNLTRTTFPYDISVTNQYSEYESGKILFKRSNGSTILNITSSTIVTGSGWYHVICQKSSSTLPWGEYSDLQVWINGTLQNSVPDKFHFDRYSNTMNKSHLLFGSRNLDINNNEKLSGSLDEVRIYNRALNQSEISSLSNNNFHSSSAYQSSVAGNAFYRTGQLVITSPLPKYHYALQNNYKLQYKSSRTIYENEVLVKVPASDCNISMNPTLRRPKSELIQSQFTGSAWKPYITTVGLYNNEAQLIAVAKLGRPIQKREDVDMNFIIRWDY